MSLETMSLVGRDAELAVLDDALTICRDGRGQALLLSGEPGIGKTALARAFSERAATSGFDVLWGRAWEAGGAPPYWLWIEVLRALFARRPSALREAAMAPGGEALAGLVPELYPGGVAPVGDAATLRFRVCDALAAMLRRATREGPLAIVLDDLHAADGPSLEALRFVTGRLHDTPIALLGTFRDAEARLAPDLGELLARVARDATTLALGPLDRDAIGMLVRRAGLPDAVAERIVTRTEGNPLFVVETLRLWRSGGQDTLPDTVRDVVTQRLALLPAETLRLLELGAAIGREVDVPWLCLASGHREVDVRSALRPALDADVIGERYADHVAFTHILIRDALYRALPEPRRVALHLALAEALERRHAMDAREKTMGLAHHYLEATPLTGLGPALHHARAAAERAIELDAHEEAMALLERALTVIDVASPGDAHALHRADVLLALGLAAMRAHEPERGRAACLEAAAIARARRDPERLAQAALALGTHITFAFVDQDLVRLLEESLEALGPTETPTRARLLARLAAALQPHADPLVPIALGQEAVAIAGRVGDAATRLEVLTAAGSAFSYFVEPAERVALTREMHALAAALGDEVRRARALLRLVFDQLEAGDAAGADEAMREHARVAARLRLPAFTWQVPLLRATRAIMEGRFADAQAALSEADATARRPTGLSAELTLTALRVGLARAARRFDRESERELVALAENAADPWYALALEAASAALGGDPDALARVLAEVAPHVEAWRHRQSIGWLAQAAVAAGDRALGARLYPLLEPLAHRCHVWGVGLMVFEGPLTEPLGLLAALLGRRNEAVLHLERAAATAGVMGARPARARIIAELATALDARAAPGDGARARSLREEAGRLAETLGWAQAAPEASEAATPAEQPQGPSAFSLVREGELWTLRHAGKYTRLKDSRGLQLLAQLVAEPGREMHVLELLGAGDGGDAGEALDAQAIRAYRERASDLREELEEALGRNDLGRIERLRGELEAIAQQLASGVGVGGRARREASNAERARVNVRRRLVLAIDRISVDLPALGRHLMRSVKTGTVCVYRPDD